MNFELECMGGPENPAPHRATFEDGGKRYIQIDSIEDLLALVSEIGEVIIFAKPPRIVLRDDYD